MDIFKRIIGMIKPYRKMFFLGIFMILCGIATRLVAPLISQIFVDDVVGKLEENGLTDQIMSTLLMAVGLLLGLLAVRMFFTYVRGWFFEKTSQSIIFDMRQHLYDHLQELPFQFYDEHRIGDIMSRLTGDVEGVRMLYINGIPQIIENSCLLIGAMVMLFTLSAPLALILIAIAPFICWAGIRLDKNIRPIFKEEREANATLNTKTQENLAGVRVVKAFAMEEREKKDFSVDNYRVRDTQIKATMVFSRIMPVNEFLSSLCSPLLLLIGGMLVINGQVTLGTLVAVTNYIWMVAGPMRMVPHIINNFSRAITSAEKIFYYTDFGSYIKEKPDAKSNDNFEGHVVFDHVDFRYGDKQVLTDINFEVKPGQTQAIMGATGTGKTTIVNLLGRFYECSGGSVKIDGIDVKDYKLHDLRKNLGYVFQETFLFSEDLANNIRFGDPEADMDRVQKAADIAEVSEFIREMPSGYDTIVGERGLGLSGGQKQRVAIARALLINPKILILDDSTSSVDMETEFRIQRALADMPGNRTTFIIAHRISSVKNADNIIVLNEEGRIAETGTHRELLEKKGLYYGMYMDQYKDFQQINADNILEEKEATPA